MAFSYSDKNFTVIGNLCFVHIDIKNKNAIYYIPDAIADRMLIKKLYYQYLTYDDKGSDIGVAFIHSGVIECNSNCNYGYLMVCFPIDSNK